jgi:para-nitrobenzyl esterase
MKIQYTKTISFTNLIVVLLSLITMSLNGQDNKQAAAQVKVENGIIEGYNDAQLGLQLYLGIPYAKPPVGELRWKAPQPVDNWQGIKETKSFGPRAVQTNIYGDMNFRSRGMSEDCLYLNVWTPANSNSIGLPVLVYFYGGGFMAGDGSEPRYDGASMAKKGIVVVTVNYRLNIFGFFAHPDLSAEATYKASGNYGLLDQNAALKWVSRNIAAFGGDPKKVTIAGESAGSLSVSVHMVSPFSKNLIAGAIGESGAAIPPALPPVPLADAEKQGLDFAISAGNYTLKQLRDMSTDDLFKLYTDSKSLGFPLVIDGYLLPKSLPEIFKSGEQAQVPLLLGWNSAELPAIAFMYTMPPYTESNFMNRVKETYPTDFEEVLKLYPHSTAKEVELSATALASDRFVVYSTWKWFDLHRKYSNEPVYRYLYSKMRPPLVDKSVTPGLAGGTVKKEEGGFKMPEPIGAPHACEIEYCMGNLYLIKDYAWTADDYKVSETMLNYFANFIKTGNPNGSGLSEWPRAEAQDNNPPVMIIDVESKAKKAENDARFLFLDKSYKNE